MNMSADELEELRRQVDEIHKALLGDFENAGIVSRLRKLEDRASIHNKVMIAIGTAVLTLIVNAIKTFFGV